VGHIERICSVGRFDNLPSRPGATDSARQGHAGELAIVDDKDFAQAGRIEARIGLRMMPTFPRSPLSFRTAGFPQYGWKAGFPSGAFLGGQRLKPAPGIRRLTSNLHPPFVRLVVSTVVPLCVGPPTRLRTAVEVITPPPQRPSLKSGL
jgi:hypothetical protein